MACLQSRYLSRDWAQRFGHRQTAVPAGPKLGRIDSLAGALSLWLRLFPVSAWIILQCYRRRAESAVTMKRSDA